MGGLFLSITFLLAGLLTSEKGRERQPDFESATMLSSGATVKLALLGGGLFFKEKSVRIATPLFSFIAILFAGCYASLTWLIPLMRCL